MTKLAGNSSLTLAKKMPGFIVSGHRGAERSNDNAALVAVLAENQETAIAVASSSDALFRPTGIIAEDDLQEQLTILAELRAKNPESKDLGFVVGGYVGEEPTNEKSGMIAILAASSDAAIVQSVEIEPDFHPAGCLYEGDLKNYAEAIQRLRTTSTSKTS